MTAEPAPVAADPEPVASTRSDRFALTLATVLDASSPGDRDAFVAGITGGDADLDDSLWGVVPTAEEGTAACLDNLRRGFAARRTVLAESLSRREAAALLEISEQAISDRLESGELIGLRQGRQWRLPGWQFAADAPRGFLPGLAELGRAFPGGPVTMTAWVARPHPDLAGATPAAMLAAGHVAEVVRLARALTAAAW